MPNIKLVKLNDHYDFEVHQYMSTSMSDWVEVTDQELADLISYAGRYKLGEEGVKVIVLEDITSKQNVQDYIHDVKKYIAELNKAEDDRKRKIAADAKKKKEASEARKIEKAKKLLEDKGILPK